MSGIIVWLTLAATLAGPPAQAAAPASQPAAGAEIGRLIEQMGSADFKVRDAAFKRLEAIGLPAYEQLKAAAEDSDDAEIASNCEKLLKALEPLAVAGRLIRERPHLAGALRELARAHPRIVMLLSGGDGQQVGAMRELRPAKGTAGMLDILYEWATKAKDDSVRDNAGYTYVLQGIKMARGELLGKDARRRRRLIEFVFADKGGWSKLRPLVQADAIYIFSQFKETAALFRAAAEKCVRAHPAVAKPLGAIAEAHPDIVAGLGGSVSQQVTALERLRHLEAVGEVLDVLDHWAKRAEDPAVRSLAGFLYASQSLAIKPMALLEKDPDRRLRLIEFVFTSTSDWASHKQGVRTSVAPALMRFEESSPLLARWLVRLRKDAKAAPRSQCSWLAFVGSQPESYHRHLVPAVMVFLDDTRTIERKWHRSGKTLYPRVADQALYTLHRMAGEKWAAGLPKVSMFYGAFIFKSDAMRKRYVTAFSTWYGKNRAEFGPNPATRPAAGQ